MKTQRKKNNMKNVFLNFKLTLVPFSKQINAIHEVGKCFSSEENYRNRTISNAPFLSLHHTEDFMSLAYLRLFFLYLINSKQFTDHFILLALLYVVAPCESRGRYGPGGKGCQLLKAGKNAACDDYFSINEAKYNRLAYM